MHIGRLAESRQVFRPIRVHEFFAAEPAALESVPELNRIKMHRELVNAPRPLALDALTRRIERDAVHFANGVDKSPVLPDVQISQRDMLRPGLFPSEVAGPAGVKIFPLHHELGQPRDAVGYPARFI